MAAFETAAELHEGLAQYALLRGLGELARENAPGFARTAAAGAAAESALLDSLLVAGPRSVRRRFYATGSGIALLLDRVAEPTWKERLVREDATLEQMLAQASGYRGPDALGLRWARRLEAELSRLKTQAALAASALGAARAAQRDSLLGRRGLHLVIDPSRLPGGRLDWCGFDPQNVLQTAAGELLHTRTLRLCSRGGVEIQFDQAAVEDRATGIVRAAVGQTSALRLTTSGGAPASVPADGTQTEMSDLRIQGPTFTLTVRRASLARRGGELWVTPLR